MLRFVAVNLYGCHLKEEVRDFFDSVTPFVNKTEPDYLIPCGSFTQVRTAPGISEAMLFVEYVMQENRLTFVPEIIKEEDSYTTLENVQNAVKRIRSIVGINGNWEEVRVDVFCEAQRALKTLILYWILLPELREHHQRVKVHTSSWELRNPLWELWHIAYDLAALRFRFLARYARRKLIEKSATR